MSNLFKITVVQHWLRNCWVGPDGAPCAEDAPGARFVKARKVKPGVPGAEKVTKKSKKWYGRVPGNRQPVPLSANKTAAGQMLAALVNKDALGKVGIRDPFEAHRTRTLTEHLAEWESSLLASGASAKHVRQTTACVRRIIDGCRFVFMADLSASRAQQFLADLRERRRALPAADAAQAEYTKKELAALLGVKPSAVPSLVRRHRLEASGNGKARRYPRATAEALRSLRTRGRSIKTSNLYLDALKAFAAWLVQDRRAADNPLAHLSGGNVKLDRRHDRRPLPLDELRRVFQSARASAHTFRGMTGRDRTALYSVACASGFRAEELSSLRPAAFNLDGDPPTVTLAAENAKNGRTAVQPLPPDIADALRDYLAGRPADQPVWPGTWYKKAAEMLRIDLDAAGIPYAVEGPDGPLYADFHALRHSYIALLDKSGATLKEAMQLARHSDPKLTMAVYGRAQLHDLGEAVRRLPALLDGGSSPAGVKATGTGGPDCLPAESVRFAPGFAPATDRGGDCLRLIEGENGGEGGNGVGRNPLISEEVAAACDPMRPNEGSSPSRTRTYNKPVNRRLCVDAESTRKHCQETLYDKSPPFARSCEALQGNAGNCGIRPAG